jgi:hypothetical protein
MNKKTCWLVLLLTGLGGAALGWFFTLHAVGTRGSALDPVTDLAGYVSLRKKILYVPATGQQTVLDELAAQDLGNGQYRITINPLFDQTMNVRFKIVATDHPHLFMWLDESLLDDAIAAAADAITDAVVDAVEDALRAEEEPVVGPDSVLFDNVKGVAVWKNARCGTPTPARVENCQGPIPPDGEELAGMYWRSTHYSRAKCVKGDDICTEIRQAGGFIEFAIDEQCNIVQDINPLDTNLYCKVRRPQ